MSIRPLVWSSGCQIVIIFFRNVVCRYCWLWLSPVVFIKYTKTDVPQVADNVALYGVCVLVPEIVQRLPGILAMNTAVSPPQSPPSRFLVSAPRCYCFLTRLPFFNLHFEVLNR